MPSKDGQVQVYDGKVVLNKGQVGVHAHCCCGEDDWDSSASCADCGNYAFQDNAIITVTGGCNTGVGTYACQQFLNFTDYCSWVWVHSAVDFFGIHYCKTSSIWAAYLVGAISGETFGDDGAFLCNTTPVWIYHEDITGLIGCNIGTKKLSGAFNLDGYNNPATVDCTGSTAHVSIG